MTLTTTPQEATIDEVVAFHGHLCPGLAMGIQASRIARREIGPPAVDEEIVAIVETDNCSVDAIQRMTGCTFAKGNLVWRDWGKTVYTFFGRADGRAIRVALRPDFDAVAGEDHRALFARVRAGGAIPEEQARFRELHQARARQLLAMAPDEMFTARVVDEPVPHRARLHASIACAGCGEAVMETRIRRAGGRDLCVPCFEQALERI